jgi:hypothetical protein
MISFVTGKPGDGKSLFATRQILEDLVNTEVFVVTNIPLNLSRVNEYVTKRRKANQRDFVLDERVKVIPDGEVYEFYRHRSGGLVLDWSPDRQGGDDGTRRIDRPSFVAKMKEQFGRIRDDVAFQKPVHYYIDEAHNFFSSREWATNGRGTLYYASQHRHLWDNVFLITQVMENVEKQLRSLVSETHAVRNQLRRRIGPIRMRPVFKVHGYYGVPAGNVKPFAITTFSLDVAGVAACYKTVGALGVHDTPEAKNNKAPLPWWVLPVLGVLAVLLIGVGLVALPMLGGKAGGAIVNGALGTSSPLPAVDAHSPAAGPQASSSGHAGSAQRDRPEAASPLEPIYPDDTPEKAVWVTGYVVRGARLNVQLSDGRVLTERDADLASVQRNAVRLRTGERIFLGGRPKVPGPVQSPPVQPAQSGDIVVSTVSLDDPASSWQVGPDGVSRLRNPSKIGY